MSRCVPVLRFCCRGPSTQPVQMQSEEEIPLHISQHTWVGRHLSPPTPPTPREIALGPHSLGPWVMGRRQAWPSSSSPSTLRSYSPRPAHGAAQFPLPGISPWGDMCGYCSTPPDAGTQWEEKVPALEWTRCQTDI